MTVSNNESDGYGWRTKVAVTQAPTWRCDAEDCEHAGYWHLPEHTNRDEAQTHTARTGHQTMVSVSTISVYGPRRMPVRGHRN